LRPVRVEYATVPLADDFAIDPAGYCGRPNAASSSPTRMRRPAACCRSTRSSASSPPPGLGRRRRRGLRRLRRKIGHFAGRPPRQPAGTSITLSKSRSLAGLRVGYAVGHPELIEGLERVKNSFNSNPLDRLAIAGAVAAIDDQAYFEQTCAAVVATRDALTADLAGQGFEVLPSAANFIFARHPAHDAGELAKALRERSIIVRHFRQPRIDQFLRITVGTDAECRALADALRAILNPAA
jgi:histidinol-phosphate aminotransferase